MNELNSWVKINRNFKNWGWYKNLVVKSVFLHLVIYASYCDETIGGRSVKRGQIITTRKKLCDELGLSEQQVRTALNHLKNTKEITCQSTRKFTLITITNYDRYQSEDTADTTNNQPTDNQQATENSPSNNQESTNKQPLFKKLINKEVKKLKSEEVVVNSACESKNQPTLDAVNEYCQQQQYEFDCISFYRYYSRYSWQYKGSPIDWKKQAEIWNEREKKEQKHRQNYTSTPASYDIDAYEDFSIFDTDDFIAPYQ